MYNLYNFKIISYDALKASKISFKAYLSLGNSNKYIHYINVRYI